MVGPIVDMSYFIWSIVYWRCSGLRLAARILPTCIRLATGCVDSLKISGSIPYHKFQIETFSLLKEVFLQDHPFICRRYLLVILLCQVVYQMDPDSSLRVASGLHNSDVVSMLRSCWYLIPSTLRTQVGHLP